MLSARMSTGWSSHSPKDFRDRPLSVTVCRGSILNGPLCRL
jgi:hypothetical protein